MERSLSDRFLTALEIICIMWLPFYFILFRDRMILEAPRYLDYSDLIAFAAGMFLFIDVWARIEVYVKGIVEDILVNIIALQYREMGDMETWEMIREKVREILEEKRSENEPGSE